MDRCGGATKEREKQTARSMTGPLVDLSGSPTWARTRDLRINSPALYRLSYRGRIPPGGGRRDYNQLSGKGLALAGFVGIGDFRLFPEVHRGIGQLLLAGGAQGRGFQRDAAERAGAVVVQQDAGGLLEVEFTAPPLDQAAALPGDRLDHRDGDEIAFFPPVTGG